jgi:hypothetical protein
LHPLAELLLAELPFMQNLLLLPEQQLLRLWL